MSQIVFIKIRTLNKFNTLPDHFESKTVRVSKPMKDNELNNSVIKIPFILLRCTLNIFFFLCKFLKIIAFQHFAMHHMRISIGTTI